MDSNQAINTADQIVYRYSGQHLNDLEIAILKGTLQKQGYKQIASDTGQANKYVKDVGALLWKKLSEAIEEKVKKGNIQSVLERYYLNQPEISQNRGRPTVIDLGNAPDVPMFFGRQDELALLKTWILHSQCRLVAILGMKGIGKTGITVRLGLGGIGKTDLTLKLIDGIQGHFDFVIWRSLLDAPPLDEIVLDWIKFLSHQQNVHLPKRLDQQILLILAYLQKNRCLLILDNFESILKSGQASNTNHAVDSGTGTELNQAGEYQDGYEGYGKLLKALGEGHHQSCLLINSRERPKDIEVSPGITNHINILKLEGLDFESSKDLLEEYGVDTSLDKDIRELTNFYNGNPLALQLVANHVQLSYLGKLNDFLNQGNRLFADINELLDWHFKRLSHHELEIIYWLAINREPISVSVLKEDLLSLDSKQLVGDTLKSLQRRIPLERTEQGFKLQPVILEHAANRLINSFIKELEHGTISLLNQYAFIKTSSSEFVRNAQIRLIVQPLIEHLSDAFEQDEIIDSLKQLLDQVRVQKRKKGYAIGNILNLLLYMGVDISRWDFSNLAIWQVDFQGTSLVETDFSNCDFYHSVFLETFVGIHSLAFSPDGKLLAAGDAVGSISIFRLSDYQKIKTLEGRDNASDWVPSVVFSADSKKLFSCCFDSVVRIWCVQSGKPLRTLYGHSGWLWSIHVSPDGKTLVSSGDDKTVRLWDVDSGRCLRVIKEHTDWVWAVKFSPDGKYLATGSYDNTIRIWETDTWTCIKVLSGHLNSIWTLAFSPDSRLLISGGLDRTLRIWDCIDGSCLKVLEGHTKEIRSVVWHPNQPGIVASGSFDKTIKIWNIHSGLCTKTLQGNSDGVRVITFSPDGKLLASGNNYQELKLWDWEQGLCLTTLNGYSNWVWSACCHPDSNVVASGTLDGIVRLWNVEHGECFRSSKSHTSWIWWTEFSPDGRFLASASDDETIALLDFESGKQLRTLTGHSNGGVWSLSFSPDSRLLASGGQDGTLRLWDVQTGSVLNVIDAHHNTWIWAVQFSPDGQTLASGSDDGSTKLWDCRTGKHLQTFPEDNSKIYSLCFHPSKPILVTGTADQCIRVWNLKNFECINTFTSEFSTWVMALSFSPDGKLLASSGNGNGNVVLRDFETNQVIHVLSGHIGTVRSVEFSSDGKTLTTAGSSDETIRIWNVSDGSCKQVLRIPRPYDGMKLYGASGLEEAQMHTLKLLGAQA
ncbi:MAG: hypothetical protein AAF821_12705 [Cyanobacteria bacterium P01_D01_bin.156]